MSLFLQAEEQTSKQTSYSNQTSYSIAKHQLPHTQLINVEKLGEA